MTTTEAMTWDERLTRLEKVGAERARLYREEQELGQAFVARLAAYEAMIEQHGLDIKVPCGFRPYAHGMGDDIFWKYNCLVDNLVVFTHDCSTDHGNRYSYGDEELIVPRMALTHPDEWLVLHALSGGKSA